ncbi:hypothetical protein ACF1AE_21765 [Streptomyces sp. NPDC014986]|uniref:hypothetical protein n=1 Tax=Streptomyces sp. NPDC014986 TaxID=3364934 RepID=UPI0036F7DA0F
MTSIDNGVYEWTANTAAETATALEAAAQLLRSHRQTADPKNWVMPSVGRRHQVQATIRLDLRDLIQTINAGTVPDETPGDDTDRPSESA